MIKICKNHRPKVNKMAKQLQTYTKRLKGFKLTSLPRTRSSLKRFVNSSNHHKQSSNSKTHWPQNPSRNNTWNKRYKNCSKLTPNWTKKSEPSDTYLKTTTRNSSTKRLDDKLLKKEWWFWRERLIRCLGLRDKSRS